jgi:hypothetical protein
MFASMGFFRLTRLENTECRIHRRTGFVEEDPSSGYLVIWSSGHLLPFPMSMAYFSSNYLSSSRAKAPRGADWIEPTEPDRTEPNR